MFGRQVKELYIQEDQGRATSDKEAAVILSMPSTAGLSLQEDFEQDHRKLELDREDQEIDQGYIVVPEKENDSIFTLMSFRQVRSLSQRPRETTTMKWKTKCSSWEWNQSSRTKGNVKTSTWGSRKATRKVISLSWE